MPSSTEYILGGLALAVIGGAVYVATKDDEKKSEEITTDELAPTDSGEGAAKSAVDNMVADNDIVARSPGITPVPRTVAREIVEQQIDIVAEAIAATNGDACEAAALLQIKLHYLEETEPGSTLYWETEALYWLVQSECDAKRLADAKRLTSAFTGRRARTGACCASCAKGHKCEAACQNH